MPSHPRGLDVFQKLSMSIMSFLVLVTFIGANLHAVLWQSSDWLVSTVLPAVVVDLTNQERTGTAAAPLQRNATLDKAAQLKAQHMAKYEYFSHFSPDGVSPWHWFNEADYLFAHAGENLAIHFTDSSEVVEAWMKSPAHRENIVNGIYTEIGVGTAKGTFEGYETVYVVQLFGTPAMVPVRAPAPQPLAASSPADTLAVADVFAVPNTQTSIVQDVVVEPAMPVADTTVVASAQDTPGRSNVLAESESLVNEAPVESPAPAAVREEPALDVGLETSEPVILAQAVPPPETVLPPAPLAPVAPTNPIVMPTELENVVVVESPTLATSSGLAVGSIVTNTPADAGGGLISFATQPNELLQIVYLFLAVIVVSLLGTSIVVEARRLHFHQVAYSFFLLFGMAGLWYAHSLLTTGAVIV